MDAFGRIRMALESVRDHPHRNFSCAGPAGAGTTVITQHDLRDLLQACEAARAVVARSARVVGVAQEVSAGLRAGTLGKVAAAQLIDAALTVEE